MGSPPQDSGKKRKSLSILSSILSFVAAFVLGILVSYIYIKFWNVPTGGPIKPEHKKQLPLSIADQNLPRYLLPDLYELTLKAYLPGYNGTIPEGKSLTFEGQVKIFMNVTKDVRQIQLNAKNLDNFKIDVIGSANFSENIYKDHSLDKDKQKLIINLGKTVQSGGKLEIKIKYTGKISKELGGLYQTKYVDNNGKEVIAAVTQMEPTDARLMVPCFDHPEFKANWSVTVLHPQGTTAISNGMELSSSNVDGQFISTSFETTPKMSSYLLAILISDFQHIKKSTKSGVMFRIWARPEAKEMMTYALEAGVKCLEYYEEYYGIPFPLKKQDMVALPDFAAGAMENWGLITYREANLLYDKKLYTPANKERVAEVIAHELAHQWFGNLVTMKWWDDLWLNEGFANRVEYLGTNVISNNSFDTNNAFLANSLSRAFKIDSEPSSHPLTYKLDYLNEINELFDGITYSKGGSILYMIENLMGEKNFVKGLNSYLNSNAYSNANANDLLSALTDAVPDDLIGPDGKKLNMTMFAIPWTQQMGYPYVTVEYLNTTHAKLVQKRFNTNPEAKEKEKFANPAYKFKWDVPVRIQYGDDKENTHIEWVPRDSEPIITVKKHPMVLNAEAYGFFRMNYDIDNWEAIFKQLQNDHTVYSPRTRHAIIQDAFAMASYDQLPYKSLFKLFEYMKNETDPIPWNTFIDQFSILLDYFGSESESEYVKNYYKQLLKPQFDKVNLDYIKNNYDKDEEYVNVTHAMLIHSTYCSLDPTACSKSFQEMYSEMVLTKCNDNDKASQCVEIMAPLRYGVYCYAVRYGSQRDFDKIMALYRKETVQKEARYLFSALSCSRDVFTLKKLLNLANNRSAGVFRSQDVASVYTDISYNEVGKELLPNYLISRWNDIYNSFSEQPDTITRIIDKCTNSIRTKAQYNQLKSFYETADNTKKYNKFVAQLDKAQRTQKWLQKNFSVLAQLFQKQ